MILDLCTGGDLSFHLSKREIFDLPVATFLIAEIMLAIEYIHSLNVIYRDLKPENILIDHEGHIKLADFGLAKILSQNEQEDPNSFCGTPEYLAPEMIIGSGHDHSLDWWALGILIYEMIIGIPPFYNQNKHQMYYLIQHAPIRWPQKEKHKIDNSPEA